ncbi:MAG: glutamate synthase subunit alpha, partial [Brachybacterium sp.]|nr:glutamate synthase subunit alpha [Brachybacterium sp.]
MLPLSSRFSRRPAAQGLYRPESESDACGVAMVATLRGRAGNDIVRHALTALENLDHRGAVGAEENTGDGAGIQLEIPDAFLRAIATAELGIDLPAPGAYAVAMAFLPREAEERAADRERIEELAAEEGLTVLGWRTVPVTLGIIGPSAEETRPHIEQGFVVDAAGERHGLALERAAFALRRRAEHATASYFPSLSTRLLVYKGMLTTTQLEQFYPDLSDPRLATRSAIVHSRFSTNTFPAWPLAHPFRTLAHNGEINTVIGNVNRMRAAESRLRTEVFGEDLTRLLPVTTPGASDSASFDEVLELLHLAGRSLPHALMMMIPEPWENDPAMDPDLRAFYEYSSMLQEPWDGPAAVVFSDGSRIGATLDRNGLRPLRHWRTQDGLVVLGSEAGLLPEIAEDVV